MQPSPTPPDQMEHNSGTAMEGSVTDTTGGRAPADTVSSGAAAETTTGGTALNELAQDAAEQQPDWGTHVEREDAGTAQGAAVADTGGGAPSAPADSASGGAAEAASGSTAPEGPPLPPPAAAPGAMEAPAATVKDNRGEGSKGQKAGAPKGKGKGHSGSAPWPQVPGVATQWPGSISDAPKRGPAAARQAWDNVQPTELAPGIGSRAPPPGWHPEVAEPPGMLLAAAAAAATLYLGMRLPVQRGLLGATTTCLPILLPISGKAPYWQPTGHSSINSHRTPAGGHRAPAGGHRAPASGHRAPAGGHRAPAGAHRAPAGGHRAPAGAHRAPAGRHSTPAGHHRALEVRQGGCPQEGCFGR